MGSSPISSAALPANSDIRNAPQWAAVGVAAVVAIAITDLLADLGARVVLLFVVGMGCGVTLRHAAFGFTSAYRRLLFARDASAAKAQLAMLAVATVLFAPVLAAGTAFGVPVVGANAPLGWPVAIGAFMFGIGMQLGDGCGSGTLYQVGAGSMRMGITLLAFCSGGFWASLHMDAWQRLPDLGAIVLGERMGWGTAVAAQLAVLAALYLLLRILEPKKDPVQSRVRVGWSRLLSGPWPLVVGAILLALLNFATLIVAGHPWSITWGFTLWAAKVARLVGWAPTGDGFWSAEFQRGALETPLLHDITSVMNLGIILGAFLAAATAGRFGPAGRIRLRSLIAAMLGGLLMGYGARIAYGCNIGAFFSGVASTSLHGWLWIAAALPGTWIGARMRPLFRLSP